MKLYFYRISSIDQLIREESTGDAQMLATRLGMARIWHHDDQWQQYYGLVILR